MGKTITEQFPVGEAEYSELDKKFGNLANYAGWQLIKKNNRNNHTDDHQDVAQELRIALLQAGSYYKRQVYIESCLSLCTEHVDDPFVFKIVEKLQFLWKNKTRHGANKQKFGPHQERLLGRIVRSYVPARLRPSKKAPLVVDSKFATYCKAITWNRQKALGKKITREKVIRANSVSLSEYDYLGSENWR
jgi:hypothetical protein